MFRNCLQKSRPFITHLQNLPHNLIPHAGQRLFAWNGIAFLTPANWELALTELSQGINRILLEDDYSPRLELDWVEAHQQLSADKIHKNSQKQVHELATAASKVIPIADIPPEWTAHEYQMEEGRTLVVGYRIPESPEIPFPFFRLHFDRHSKEIPSVCFRQLAASFTSFAEGPTPWAFYDVGFSLPRELRLTGTSLQAGRKTLIFEWRLRRLFLWYISLADIALRTKSLAEYTADFLNATKLLPVPFWHPKGTEEIVHTRKKRYFLGQFEEIGRLCFHYQARAQLIQGKNQIAIQMAQFRKESDLDRLRLSPLTLVQ